MCRSAVAAAADICAICLEDLDDNNTPTMTTFCGHTYHKLCMEECRKKCANSHLLFVEHNGNLSSAKYTDGAFSIAYVLRCPLCRQIYDLERCNDRYSSKTFRQLFCALCKDPRFRFHPSRSQFEKLQRVFKRLVRELGVDEACFRLVNHVVIDEMSESLHSSNVVLVANRRSPGSSPTTAAP